ncbi:MAG: ORF6N domain-containing protein [Bacteroidota bacterium]
MEIQTIQSKIHTIRGQKVMLDYDLAELYEVQTRTLKQLVRRNIARFPDDFMFALSHEEISALVSQNVIPSKSRLGGAFPFAFTEQGVAMLAGILKSEKAIQINIVIIRAFVALRHFALSHAELSLKIAELEVFLGKELSDIKEVLLWLGEENQARADAIAALENQEKPAEEREERRMIGFRKG